MDEYMRTIRKIQDTLADADERFGAVMQSGDWEADPLKAMRMLRTVSMFTHQAADALMKLAKLPKPEDQSEGQ